MAVVPPEIIGGGVLLAAIVGSIAAAIWFARRDAKGRAEVERKRAEGALEAQERAVAAAEAERRRVDDL